MELHDRLEENFRLNDSQKKALRKLKLFTVHDLLFYFPVRYSHISEIKPINQLIIGEIVTIYGRFWKPDIKRSYKSKRIRAEGEVTDETGKIKVIWFNQAFIAKMLHSGQFVELTGKVTKGKRGIYLANPEYKKMESMPIDVHHSLFNSENKKETEVFGFPIYNETRGITSKWIYHTILKIIKDKTLESIKDYIPEDILKKYHLPSLKSALFWIHSPRSEKDALSARKRFAFEEVFFIQLERQHDRLEYKKNKAFTILGSKKVTEDFLKRFPFTPTNSQKKSISTILSDISKDYPMSRLLEGDVGSGKTAVAATVAYNTILQKPNGQKFGNLQMAYMAPTEILATQHFESFIQYFKHLPINIALITGSGCKKFPGKVNPEGYTTISRSQLLKWVENGEIPILIGTHTLIQKTVRFKNLALVVIDEQHRFGTAQRRKLIKKGGIAPHLLSMTATPIPRTLALTIYGDLDLSLLDEMPKDRKEIITEIVIPEKRNDIYERIRTELKLGRQLYVICPRIFEPDPKKEMALQAKSAIAEAKRLKKEVFKEYEIDVLHSKMNKQKKEEVMKNFSEGKTNILCATSVIEVGVNVPNATSIIIEGAERFGLAQLHQLRGRVIRSNHQAYCYIFAETKTQKTIDRLRALKTAKNGFELAELDLTLRGAGELGGGKQWGITDLGMEAIRNLKMVEAARIEAISIIEKDLELEKYPLLRTQIKERAKEFHFE
ncbi:MAG: ATP-dependent DNA helicase RecG [Candidatus Paceibacterota bacterium]